MTRHPRLKARRDGNEAEIIAVLEGLGCAVFQIYDWADLIVGLGNPLITVIVEVKLPGAPLTAKEKQYQRTNKGQYWIVRTVDEAIEMVERYRNVLE